MQQVEQVKQVEQKTNEKPSKCTKGRAPQVQAPGPCSGLGAAIAAELMIGLELEQF